jgi:hypothetical protein
MRWIKLLDDMKVAAEDANVFFVPLAESLDWFTKDGKPYKMLVQRLIKALIEDKLVKKQSGRFVLTRAGLKEAQMASLDDDDLPF